MPGTVSKTIDTAKVEELRNKVLKDYEEHPDLYHPQDIERFKEDDWYCQRFLLHLENTPEQALKMAKDALQWRKKFGVSDLHEDNLPTEFFELGGTIPFNKDKEGHSIILVKVKLHRKREEEAEDVRRFLVYWVEKLDRMNEGEGITVIYDCRDSGLSNLDMDVIKFMIDLFKNYYPHTLGYLLVYDMPWLFNAAWKIVKTWLSKSAVERIKFVSGNEIFDYVDKPMLPVDMGGSTNKEYVYKQGSCGSCLQPVNVLKEKVAA
ncbi:motile sperm domain-containing protein 2-like [Centruroides vittatus]|uniref:motile sperm domain-containing protein 2-like n=1 Tax=Centruroides vittatus TaxID=120091 RepID=UPI00350F4DA9